MPKLVVLTSNTSWNIVNFRGGLVHRLIRDGFEVVAVAPMDDYSGRIEGLGCRFVPLEMDNMGRSPLRDLLLLARFVRILRHEKPFCMLGFTIKPNIYGSIACARLGIPVINNIAGLGSVFGNSGPTQWLVKRMYRVALANSSRVYFQNEYDQRIFLAQKIVSPDKTEVLPGSGVDPHHFAPRAKSASHDSFIFLFMGRLLREKGLVEYVEAARTIKAQRPDVRFQILGFAGVENPSSVQHEQIEQWAGQGIVEILGAADDVRPYIGEADCVVLPSYYREGVPRSLLEAASMERPVITTDTPGCRETLVDGETGFLTEPRNVLHLVGKMNQMLDLSKHSQDEMGRKGRLHVQARFDEQIVLERYMSAISRIQDMQRH